MPVPGTTTMLHKKPALAPLIALICLVVGFALLFTGARTFPKFARRLESFADDDKSLVTAALVFSVAAIAFAVFDHLQRLKPPPVPVYLRLNRAVIYGIAFSMSAHLLWTVSHKEHIHHILFDVTTQVIALGMIVVLALVSYFGWLYPLCDDVIEDFPPYQQKVQALTNSYDFILGIERPDDWKKALLGRRQWTLFPEGSLWTNLLVLGGIGSGKTSALAYPIIMQALGKYPNDPALRPSIVLLDLKGDNALRMYELCKSLGREKEFWCVSPGNLLLDENEHPITNARGKPIIPADRFIRWNPIGGTQAADIRSSLLLDGLSATNDGPKMGGSTEYFENVEAEFLQKTLELLDLTQGVGKTNLLDVYLFANDPQFRRRVVNADMPEIQNSPARLYFVNYFERLDADEQGTLISGLKAKLAKLTSKTLQSTFCPPEDAPNNFPGFTKLVINNPGVVVFSVPDSIYSRNLTRVLGIMFMRQFHTEMLRRSTTQFSATGGNTKRVVFQVTDECWAFMNKGVGDFTAVSRQARACSIFLSQSLEQFPENYRAVIEGNFRTKVLLGVNDSTTLKKFSELFGEVKEFQTSTSMSENLNDVSHNVVTQGVSGKNQGLSMSTSTQERLVPRFSQTEIQHLPENRAIVHLYDGKVQHSATCFEVTPYFRLPYHLLHPLEHRSIGCPHERMRAPHALVAQADGSLRCTLCGHVLSGSDLTDYRAYQRAFPHLVPGIAA